ncbi:MAG: GNAT family N-acetyltransferase [Planctomycetota bacterium]
MIKKEAIIHAIRSITMRDCDVGGALMKMYASGRIMIPLPSEQSLNPDDFFFYFDWDRITLKKFLYLNEGTATIEQHLLRKYGEEMSRNSRLDHLGGTGSITTEAFARTKEDRDHGLRFMVNHEIDRALAERPDLQLLRSIRNEERCPGQRNEGSRSPLSFTGKLRGGEPAVFIPFPWSVNALMQVAEMNMEFFDVRFFLNCLCRGKKDRLFACLLQDTIAGLVYLDLKENLFYQGLEIKYLATSGRSKGVGAFLVAAVWMLWNTRHLKVREIFLDSEIGAVEFYKRLGFHPRGLYEYTMRTPSARLLRELVQMLRHIEPSRDGIVQKIKKLVIKQIKSLRKKAGEPRAAEEITDLLNACLQKNVHPEIRDTVVKTLLRYRDRIKKSDEFIRRAEGNGLVLVNRIHGENTRHIQVVSSKKFTEHLENIFHLENARRIDAIHSALDHASLDGRWSGIVPRPATLEELAWVHTPEHIRLVASTAGKPLFSFDPDTQTTEKSFEVAQLAAGAVFNLLDSVWDGESSRGFAAIRPPGHHAEPGRAMGFCLFNNAALGAMYLKKKYGARKVMIIDIDAHHGNGTQAAFYDTDEVLYLSMHQFPGYPGTGALGEVGRDRGEGYTVNIPMRRGFDDRHFARAIHFIARPIATAYRPEFVLVSLGFDLYRNDRLGVMSCTPKGYALFTSLLQEIADEVSQGRIAFIMEGGYSVKGIRECGLRVFQEMCGINTLNRNAIDKIKRCSVSQRHFLRKVVDVQKKYWDIRP